MVTRGKKQHKKREREQEEHQEQQQGLAQRRLPQARVQEQRSKQPPLPREQSPPWQRQLPGPPRLIEGQPGRPVWRAQQPLPGQPAQPPLPKPRQEGHEVLHVERSAPPQPPVPQPPPVQLQSPLPQQPALPPQPPLPPLSAVELEQRATLATHIAALGFPPALLDTAWNAWMVARTSTIMNVRSVLVAPTGDDVEFIFVCTGLLETIKSGEDLRQQLEDAELDPTHVALAVAAFGFLHASQRTDVWHEPLIDRWRSLHVRRLHLHYLFHCVNPERQSYSFFHGMCIYLM